MWVYGWRISWDPYHFIFHGFYIPWTSPTQNLIKGHCCQNSGESKVLGNCYFVIQSWLYALYLCACWWVTWSFPQTHKCHCLVIYLLFMLSGRWRGPRSVYFIHLSETTGWLFWWCEVCLHLRLILFYCCVSCSCCRNIISMIPQGPDVRPLHFPDHFIPHSPQLSGWGKWWWLTRGWWGAGRGGGWKNWRWL